MQTICTNLNEFPDLLSIVERYASVYCSVGVHPMHVHEEENCTAERLISLSQHPKVISLGETGLDYYYSKEHARIQKECFTQHIIAAQITGLPLIIHARDADEDIAEMLESHLKNKPFSAVIHCFTEKHNG